MKRTTIAAAIGITAACLAPSAPAQCLPSPLPKLTAPDPQTADVFGRAIAVDADTAVVSIHNDDNPGADNSGAVYIATRAGDTWTLGQRLTAPTPEAGAAFGMAVAMSGDLIAVGAPYQNVGSATDAGAVHVFARGAAGVWTHQAELNASDAWFSDHFGAAVDIDGLTIVVGSPDDDTQFLEDFGSAYIYVRVDDSWVEQAHIFHDLGPEYGNFAKAVAVDGDTALLGADTADSPAAPSAGRVLVFVRQDGVWTLQARLHAADGATADHFGVALAQHADTALIGADGDDYSGFNGAGAAYIFVRSGSAWTQQARLTPEFPATGDFFGSTVALDADTAAVGAYSDSPPQGADAGSATLFARTGAAWARTATLTAADGAPGDFFGQGVALAGTRLLVGANSDDHSGVFHAGSVYPFDLRRTDFNHDGAVNSTDVSDFINQWFQDQVDGALLTDWDDNGVVNSTDVSAFINDWFADLAAGCG